MNRIWIIFFLQFFFISHSWAGSKIVPKNTLLKINGSTQSETHEEIFRKYIQLLIERDLEIQFRNAMEGNRLSDSDIQTVLESPEFKNYAHRVSHHPKVGLSISRLMDHLAKPRTISHENEVELASLSAERSIALKHFLLEKRIAGTGYVAQEEPGFFKEAWNRFTAYFLE